MICKRVRVVNFRNIKEAEVSFGEGVNILSGKNAQGKTNLLEAIFFAAIGKSFRTSHEEDLIRMGEDFAEVSVDFADSVREQNLTVRLMRGKRRRIEHNRLRLTKLSEAVGLFRTVLFGPEHLSIVKEGPAERRNFLDVAISQLYPVYLRALQNYHRVLAQRNKLIRDAEKEPEAFRQTVEFWSEQLAEASAIAADYRLRYIERLDPVVGELFREMTDGQEVPELIYEPSPKMEEDVIRNPAAAKERILAQLTGNTERELAAGTTLWGAHKDDVRIRLNGSEARSFASQGQQRSLALAMKLAEGEICGQVCRETPVFLFDDVFSELDGTRRKYLAEKLTGRQVIITSCEPNLPGGNVIRVENGTYRQL